MVSIIIQCNEQTAQQAQQAGFTKQEVWIRHNAVQSTRENKDRLESELFKMKPYQFLVSDFWGASVESVE